MMTVWERFAAPGPADAPSLQVLFGGVPAVPAEGLTAALRDYHPDLAEATAEFMPVSELPSGVQVVSPDGPPALAIGLASWGEHRVKVILFAEPMPASAVEGCVQAALLPPDLKAEGRAHQGHALLYYAGTASDPLEQCVALGAVAGALAHFDAILTLNEEARAAIPSFALLPDEDGEDMLATLRTLPLPYLWGGYVKMELTDIPGVWIRTFANHRFGLPNLAYHAASHDEGQQVFRMFAGILGYMRETGLRFELGEVVRIDEDTHLHVREAHLAEWWLDALGEMRVLERVTLEE